MRMHSQVSKRTLQATFGVLASSALFLAGCNGFVGTAPATVSFGSPASVMGTVHGGQQPVYNAVVRLYAAGTTGYGTGSTLLATSANSDTSGAFAFTKSGTNSDTVTPGSPTWACPTVGNPIIYVTAIGGNTQGTGVTSTNNTASGLMAVLGPCSGVSNSTHVGLNEISTVASVFAMAQYINPGTTPGTEAMGTSGSPQGSVGLNNAAASVVNLADITNGALATPPQYTGSGSASGITVTATAEAQKIATIANILAACINSVDGSSTNCADLFASAQSASGTAPSDTVQAAYYMATNPINAGTFGSCNNGATTKTGCLFGLASGAGAPFQTSLSAQPLDWTIGVTYTATGTCSGAAGGGNPGGGNFITGTYRSAVDATGNIWFISGASSGANISEMSPTGTPLLCFGNGANGRGITIDPTGNVWGSFNLASALTADIQELPAGSTTPVAWPVSTNAPYAVVSDGQGNIFYSFVTANGGFNEFIAPGATTTPFPSVNLATGVYSASNPTIGYLAVDSTNRVWGSTSTTPLIFGLVPGASQVPSPIVSYQIASNIVTFTSANTFTTGTTVTIAGLSNGNYLNGQSLPVLASPAPSTTQFSVAFTHVDVPLTVDVGTATPAVAYTEGSATSKQNNYGMAVDSTNHLYAGTSCCNSTNYHLIEKFTPGATVSATTFVASPGYLGGINGVRSVALDGAGNVWVGTEYPTTGNSLTTGNYAISELAVNGSTFTALSPATTFTPVTAAPGTVNCSTTVGCPTGGGFIKTDLGETRDVIIDPSGNVWAFNYGTEAVQNTGTTIVEIVGAAAPTVQPYSVAAKNGTLATKP